MVAYLRMQKSADLEKSIRLDTVWDNRVCLKMQGQQQL